jgi:serine/threonine protein kinase
LIKLRSPNIVGFEEAIYSAEKQRIFIVLEYCSKGSLLKIINGAAGVPVAEWHKTAKKYFIQMTKGLLKSNSLL